MVLHTSHVHIENCRHAMHALLVLIVLFRVHLLDKKLSMIEKRALDR